MYFLYNIGEVLLLGFLWSTFCTQVGHGPELDSQNVSVTILYSVCVFDTCTFEIPYQVQRAIYINHLSHTAGNLKSFF